jgi:hypothetical protein
MEFERNSSAPLVELSIHDIIGFPDEIDGCGCYFDFTQEKLGRNEFAFLNNYEGVAFVNINNELVRFEIVESERNPDEFGDYDHTEHYKSESYTLYIEKKIVESIGVEVWWFEAVMTLEDNAGQIVTAKLVGECGC